LAHHYTQAAKAIPLWHKAGGLALNRLALAEAIAHLNKGLELVAALPPSAERDGKELDLRTFSGMRGTPSKAGKLGRFGTACISRSGWRTRSAATMLCYRYYMDFGRVC
jgi:hypothetical protein